jgi:hypothetical protein
MVVRPLDARDPGKMVNLALMRVTNATDFTFSYPDYEVYRDSAHSFSGVIAVKFERLRLTNAGGIVSKRTYAAELPALAWISGKNREPFTCLAAPNLPRTPDGPTGPVNTEDSYALLGNNYSSQGLDPILQLFPRIDRFRTSEFGGNSRSSKLTPGVACTPLMRAWVNRLVCGSRAASPCWRNAFTVSSTFPTSRPM